MHLTLRLSPPTLLGLMVSIGALAASGSAQTPPAHPSGPYLGQTPPGKTPVVFAPGIVSTGAHEFSFSTNSDATEIYFARGTGPNNVKQIMVTRQVNGVWTGQAPLFPDFQGEQFEPCVTPDGRYLYFMAFLQGDGQQRPSIDMYRAERKGNGWGKPYLLNSPFNPGGAMFPSVTRDGVVYATDTKTGNNDIARTRPTANGFGSFENLGAPINTDAMEAYSFVAPDESYIIFCRMAPAGGGMLVSFKTGDGKWSAPQQIPLGMHGGTPFVSRDGKYLFFVSGRMPSDLYWVSFDVVNDLRPGGNQ